MGARFCLAVITIACLLTGAGAMERLSVDNVGVQGNSESGLAYQLALSADGRLSAFTSSASNLALPVDNNYACDVFLRDRWVQIIMRASVDSLGAEGDSDSYAPALNADGRLVAFESSSSNLVPGDTNSCCDIFVRDWRTGATERISVATGGGQANGPSYGPAISGDGRYVAFYSFASNLVAGDTNGDPAWYTGADVFLRDRLTGVTQRVSVATDGTQGNDESAVSGLLAVSADGRYVAFDSFASNLVAGDTNGTGDVFVRDRQTGATTRVSVASDRSEVMGDSGFCGVAISADGRYVAFESMAYNLIENDTNSTRDIFRHDRTTGSTIRVSVSTAGVESNGMSLWPAMSADGRYVAFCSDGDNLVAGDTNDWQDIFVHDCTTGATALASAGLGGAGANGASFQLALSGDGRIVEFTSNAANLVAGDTNNRQDVFATGNPIYAGPAWFIDAPSLTPDSGNTATTFTASVRYSNPQPTGPTVANLLYSVDGGAWVTRAMTTTDTGYADGSMFTWSGNLPAGRIAYAFSFTVGSTTLRLPPVTGGLAGPVVSPGPPATPTGLTATATGSSSIRLTWADVAGETSYRVERRTGGGAYALVATVAANAAAWSDTTCARHTAYGYRLRAENGAGSSGWATAAATTPSFDDVLPSSGQWSYVEAMYREGITAGCQTSPPLYCPANAVTRGQMAVFLCRAAGWSPVNSATPSFADVPKTSPQYGYVEAMKSHGVTSGCGGTPVNYCPDSPVTRGQMAVFLCRAAGVATANPATPTFGDVPQTSGQYTYIEGLSAAHITAGCQSSPPLYCPDASVTRGQMAVFLCRAFAIPL